MKKSDLMPYPGVEGYLPGCYAHMRPQHDESLPGFLLRLAEANHYRDIQALLTSVFPEAKEALRPKIAGLRLSPGHLARLSRVACGDAAALSHFRVIKLPSNALLIHGCRVPAHGFLVEGGAYCPHCLAENGYAREEWELAPVTVCSYHHCDLQETCPQCGAMLTWKRLHLVYCHDCNSSLLQSVGNSAITDEALQAADDFSALADFRVEFSPGNAGVISWEEMLNVAQALTQPSSAWLSLALSRTHEFMRLPLQERRLTIEKIARTRDHRATYRLHQLQPLIHEKLAVLGHFLPRDYLAETAFKFLMQCEQLSSQTALALSGYTTQHLHGDGAHLCDGRPPSISSEKDVDAFLGIVGLEYRYLRRHNYIPFHDPEESQGIDIDYLFEAKNFMENRMAGLDILSRMIGIEMSWDSLCRLPIPIHVPDLLRGEKRIAFDKLSEVQLMWLDKTASMSVPDDPVRLSDALPLDSISALSACLSAILNGRLSKCQWLPPYRWTDFSVERSELAALGFNTKQPDSLGCATPNIEDAHK